MPMDWGLAQDYAARDGCLEQIRVTEDEWPLEVHRTLTRGSI
jgi:hypothetical protein